MKMKLTFFLIILFFLVSPSRVLAEESNNYSVNGMAGWTALVAEAEDHNIHVADNGMAGWAALVAEVEKRNFPVVDNGMTSWATRVAEIEERSIYVGDLIEIRITSQQFSEEELREKFNDFEIVTLEKILDGYLLTLRTFETGEKTILLGDKEIIIAVKSTLDEIEQTGVFEGDLTPEDPGFSPDWRVVAGITALLLLSSGGILLTKYLQKRKAASLTPWQRFLKGLDAISLEDKDAFVHMTFCLKEYLESTFLFRIRGKTTSEIMKELYCIPELQVKLPGIQTWLEESDYLKFSGAIVPGTKRQELLTTLKNLVEKMEASKEGKT